MSEIGDPVVTLKLAGESDQIMLLSEAVLKAKAFLDLNVGQTARFRMDSGRMLNIAQAEEMLGASP